MNRNPPVLNLLTHEFISVYNLSNREVEILEMLLLHFTNPEIAVKLAISRDTVKFHLKNINRKLGVSTRQEAARKSIIEIEGP
jgi:DNA-binding CsgD family transcriptional regulator